MLNSVFKQESISHRPVVFVYSEYLCGFPALSFKKGWLATWGNPGLLKDTFYVVESCRVEVYLHISML